MKSTEQYSDEIERYCIYRSLKLAEVFSDIEGSY